MLVHLADAALQGLPELDAPVPVLMAFLAIYTLLFFSGVVADVLLLKRRPLWAPLWQVGVQRLTERAWSGKDAGQVILILVIVQAVGAGVRETVMQLGWIPDENTDVWSIIMQGVLLHGVGLGLILWTLRKRQWSWSHAFGFELSSLARSLKAGIWGYLAMMPVLIASSIVYDVVLVKVGYPMSLQDAPLIFMQADTVWVQVVVFVLAFMLAPVTEEALFRGIGLPLCMRVCGVRVGILIVSACFALIHFHIPSLVPIFVLAVSLSVAYIYTGSLLVPMVMHALFNGVSLFMMLAISTR